MQKREAGRSQKRVLPKPIGKGGGKVKPEGWGDAVGGCRIGCREAPTNKEGLGGWRVHG